MFFAVECCRLQGNSVLIVDDPIEDCVCYGRFSYQVVPLGDGKLRGDLRRIPAIAFLEDFQQVEESDHRARQSQGLRTDAACADTGWNDRAGQLGDRRRTQARFFLCRSGM